MDHVITSPETIPSRFPLADPEEGRGKNEPTGVVAHPMHSVLKIKKSANRSASSAPPTGRWIESGMDGPDHVYEIHGKTKSGKARLRRPFLRKHEEVGEGR